ncbi:glutamate receptor ionotropic, kainate 2-like [Pocillopora damicornis]|uniref:glutamate receptor ionotropic, kainate 2-like n=1 Tax=Pocillopora damicornis TaxID=46731 RepID=UPI000F54F2BC|nr:glutamate receptor ionotropic, kainate 2-like [Pocillopora damicornis]
MSCTNLVFVTFLAFFVCFRLLPVKGVQVFKLGAIFPKNNTDLDEKILRFAIDTVNKEGWLSNITLNCSIRYAAADNSFENIYKVNQLINEGVIAIIGPKTSVAVKATHPLCSKLQIPQISASATDPDLYFNSRGRYRYLLRMSPDDTQMNIAMKELIAHHKWKRMGILTASTLYDMNALSQFIGFATAKKWEILGVEHFTVTAGSYKINATKNLLNLREKGARVILLSCQADYVPQVLEQAEQLDMIREWVWILTDNAISQDNRDISYKEGVIGVRLPVRGRGQLFDSVSKEWSKIDETSSINARSGRIYDAVLTVARAIEGILSQNESLSQPPVGNGLCRSDKPCKTNVDAIQFKCSFQSPPFVMKKENSTNSNSDVEYEGFCIDLLDELKKKLQFEYHLELRDNFGDQQSDGTWSGIIGELTRKKAQLAVSTIIISPEREKAVDFTQPYYSLGFKIVMKKTDMENKVNTWGFLDPFEKTLWIAIISSSVIIGTVVWIYDRLSPYGYYGKVVQSAEVSSEEALAKNTLSLFHSFWAAVASYLEQTPDNLHPISQSGRATTLACSEAKLPVYEKLWDFIERHGTLEKNHTAGIEKVRNTENYAFIWDSAVLEYDVQQEPCNTLTLIERPFGSINYGFALPRNSLYTHNFSVAMLELQQDGFLQRMKEKWFKSRSVCGAETQAAQEAAEEGGDQLQFSDLAGVFITLVVGVAAGLIVLSMELIYASYKDTQSKDGEAPNTLCAALWRRLRRTYKGFHDLHKRDEGEKQKEEDLAMSEGLLLPSALETQNI